MNFAHGLGRCTETLDPRDLRRPLFSGYGHLQSPGIRLQLFVAASLAAGAQQTMAGQNEATARNTVTRRGFLKRVALVGAAASALGILSRGRIGGIGQQGRSTPADLPGAGSIFQPRGDSRIQPERYESRLFSFIRKERVADTPPHGD